MMSPSYFVYLLTGEVTILTYPCPDALKKISRDHVTGRYEES